MLTDVAAKTALIDSGPRPFFLHCLPPLGGLTDASSAAFSGNIVNDILVEMRVHLVAEKLTSPEWLQPGYTRTGLRHAAR